MMAAAQLDIKLISRKASRQIKDAEASGYLIADVTSNSPNPTWAQLSPMTPVHPPLPIPGNPGRTTVTVEGAWQGLKVFDTAGVDLSRLTQTNKTGMKRTVRKYGKVKGHKFGQQLLSYAEARKRLYVPLYNSALRERRQAAVQQLLQAALDHGGKLALLDYSTNEDVYNLGQPLSHAGLVKKELLRLHGGGAVGAAEEEQQQQQQQQEEGPVVTKEETAAAEEKPAAAEKKLVEVKEKPVAAKEAKSKSKVEVAGDDWLMG